jgi:YbgC/YbaW family acyl-CoA thioester hydrolase
MRYDECDPFGYLGNASFLRYAAQAAIEAAGAAGYDLIAGALRWIPQEIGIEYIHPLAYGETLKIKTWLSDWRNDDVSLEQELLVANSGKLAAKVYGDWDFINVDTLESAPTPGALVAAFFPERPPPESPARSPFPEPPPAPSGAFTLHRRVRWHHLNPLGYMDSAHYFTLLEEAAADAAEYAGWPLKRADEQGFAYFVKEHHIEYGQPTVMGDLLAITTYIGEVGDTSVTRHYLIELPDRDIVARAQTTWLFVDPTTNRPLPIPKAWLIDFAEQIVEE